MNPFKTLPLLAALATTAHAGEAKSGLTPAGDWEFSLSFGSGFRQSGTLGFAGGSRSPGTFVPSFVGDDVWTVPPIGDPSAPDDRYYDDGFVRPDASTNVDGLTGFWGYQTPGQVDVPGDSIRFHATGAQSIRSDLRTVARAPREDERARGIAPVLHFEARHRGLLAGGRPGLSASLSWLPVSFDRQWSDLRVGQSREDYRIDWTDTYNLGGVGSQIPTAPYTGTFEGPGFLLENQPDSRISNAVLIGSEDALVRNRVTARFRADHTTLSFGPTMTHALSPDWNLQVGMGLSVHWLHWSSRQSEQLNLYQGGTMRRLDGWNSASSGDKILGGIYLQLQAEWTPRGSLWSAKGLFRTDFGQSFADQVGPSRFTYDPDGATAVIMLSRKL